MTTFYICRHGETENNRARRLSGWIDTPLTPEGRASTLAAAAKLSAVPVNRIIASDLGRAFITAYEIARKLNFTDEIQRTPELREVNYGELANRPYHDYPDLTPDENTNFVPPNGESLQQMQDRVLNYLRAIAEGATGSILIVAHDGTINAIRSAVTGESMGQADQTHNAHDFVASFELADGKILSFKELHS
jgi:probable phosphoglycerate mutase